MAISSKEIQKIQKFLKTNFDEDITDKNLIISIQKLLSEYKDIYEDITKFDEVSRDEYKIIVYDDNEYIITTEKNAEQYAYDIARSTVKDMGLESFSEDYVWHVVYNFCDEDDLERIVRESIESDIENEYNDDDMIEDLLDELEERISSFDRSEYEDEEGNIKEDLSIDDILKDYRDELIEDRLNDQNFIDYLIDIYGEGKSLLKFIENNVNINWDDVIEDMIKTDGLGHFLSSYDGELHYLDGKYVGWRES